MDNYQVDLISKRFKLMKVSVDGKPVFIKGTSFPTNPQPSCIIANNKFLTKKVLKKAGILTPKSYLAKTPKQVLEIVEKKKMYPCVLKPTKGAHGNKVYANIETKEELLQMIQNIYEDKKKKDVLIEAHITGRDYRVLVVGDKASAVMERIPAHIIGDGKSSIRQLITRFNSNPLVGKKYEKPLCKIKINGEVRRILKKQGLKFNSILEKDRRVFVRQNANISTGGIGKDATNEVPEIVKTTAIKAAQATGMKITGVDILYDKLSKKAYVIELNDQPGIDIHHFPVVGKSQNVAKDIVEYILKKNKTETSENFTPKETYTHKNYSNKSIFSSTESDCKKTVFQIESLKLPTPLNQHLSTPLPTDSISSPIKTSSLKRS